jgi:ribosome recycling factor
MIDEELFDAEEKMEKAVTSAKDDLSTLRTGRANPNMFARIQIDYYGAPTPMTQMATITVPEARMAVIKPYDMSQLSAIEKAIRDSDLGVNPSNDGHILRVLFPQLTEERRRELGKTARAKGEDARVAIRNVRRRTKDSIDKLVKDKESEVSEDDGRTAEKELQTITDRYVAIIDELVKHKEAELLEV